MKRTLSVIISIALLSACNQPADHAEANIAATRKMFAAFNQHNWQEMANCYTDTAEFLDPAFGNKYVKKTRKETAGKYAGMQQMFADIKDDVEAINASGNVVTVQFTSSGTPAGGSRWQLPICSVLTFNNQGKIIKDATYYDNE